MVRLVEVGNGSNGTEDERHRAGAERRGSAGALGDATSGRAGGLASTGGGLGESSRRDGGVEPSRRQNGGRGRGGGRLGAQAGEDGGDGRLSAGSSGRGGRDNGRGRGDSRGDGSGATGQTELAGVVGGRVGCLDLESVARAAGEVLGNVPGERSTSGGA
jgi:hypothetical protein